MSGETACKPSTPCDIANSSETMPNRMSRGATAALLVVALLVGLIAVLIFARQVALDRGQRIYDSYSKRSYELGDALANAPGVTRHYTPNVQGPCSDSSDPSSWVEFPYMVKSGMEMQFQGFVVSEMRNRFPGLSIIRAPNSTRVPVKAVGQWEGHSAEIQVYRPPRTTAKGVKYRVVAGFDPGTCGITY